MAGGGGAWKVAYADFVTAMMAFFMVMWLVSQNAKVKEAVAEHFREPDMPSLFTPNGKPGNSHRREKGPKPGKPSGNNLAGTGDQTGLKNPRQGSNPESETTGVSFAIPFHEDQATMDEEVKSTIDKKLPMVLGKAFKLEIRAHSSRRRLPPDSPYKDHWDLCYQRCQAVMNHLVKRGVEPERIRISQSGVYEPQSNKEDSRSEATNARVEVKMLAESARRVQPVKSDLDDEWYDAD